MMLADWLIVLAVLFFLSLAFFFSGSETAMTASSRGTMLRLSKDGNPDAAIVTRLLDDRHRFIGALLIGGNVATIVSSTLATALLHEWFGDIGVLYASVVMTVLVILFCEMLPKTAAIDAPDRYALSIARPLQRVIRILGPVLDAAEWIVRRMLAIAGIVPGAGEPLLPGHESLRGAVDLLHKEGSFEKQDRDMLGGLLNLRDLIVADVMIHRTEVITADVGEPPEQVVETVLKEPVTRVPLWRGTPENIVGILHVRDLLRGIKEAGGDAKKVDIMALARQPWFVPETRSLSEQLMAFRRRHTPLAVVVDEYGEFMGIVTLEDILEEIVGDISDEHDVEIPGVRLLPDGAVNVDGAVPIRDLNRAMDWSLPDTQATTIAGLVIHESRSIPEAGQSFTFHGFRFEVLRRNRNRLEALRITPVTQTQKTAAKAS
jgi:magnesium and cobalt exporter, CNNM family